MGIITVILGCTLLLLSGCMENPRLAKAPVSNASTLDYCQQHHGSCSYAYSPIWHDVFK